MSVPLSHRGVTPSPVSCELLLHGGEMSCGEASGLGAAGFYAKRGPDEHVLGVVTNGQSKTEPVLHVCFVLV